MWICKVQPYFPFLLEIGQNVSADHMAFHFAHLASVDLEFYISWDKISHQPMWIQYPHQLVWNFTKADVKLSYLGSGRSIHIDDRRERHNIPHHFMLIQYYLTMYWIMTSNDVQLYKIGIEFHIKWLRSLHQLIWVRHYQNLGDLFLFLLWTSISVVELRWI